MHKVLIVVGTRPEVIKMAPVYFALRSSVKLSPVMLSTGQHQEMLNQAFSSFELKPDVDLKLMQRGQSLSDLTSRVIVSLSNYLQANKFSAMLVQGDTTSVFAAALAGFYAKVPVGHVEAGLRTYNYDAPWPEEMNRRLTAPICEWCFAPTIVSKRNLLREYVPEKKCFVTGNTVIDSLLWMRDKLTKSNILASEVAHRANIPDSFRKRYLDGSNRWILITGHRRESFGGGFERICESITRVVNEHENLGILYPVHLNPQVREPVKRMLGGNERVALIEPVGYEDFIWLMNKCYFVLSDSGGVQEEAPGLGKPVLVMRDTTERPEGIEAGTCRLVGTDPKVIADEVRILLRDNNEYKMRSELRNPYGQGDAAYKIKEILEKDLT